MFPLKFMFDKYNAGMYFVPEILYKEYKEELIKILPSNIFLTVDNVAIIMYNLNYFFDDVMTKEKINFINYLNKTNEFYNNLKINIYKKLKNKIIKINNNLTTIKSNISSNVDIKINKKHINIINTNIEITPEDDDEIFFLKKVLKDDISTNINFNKLLNIKTNNIPEEFRMEINDSKTLDYLNQNKKVDTKQIIEKILEKILDDVDHKIYNILLSKKIEKRKEQDFELKQQQIFNNNYLTQILAGEINTNIFGYDINNTEDLKKYLEIYNNNLYKYIQDVDKNIKSLSMLSFNVKKIYMNSKTSNKNVYFRTTKNSFLTTNSTNDEIRYDNIETYIHDFFLKQENPYKKTKSKNRFFLYIYLKETKFETQNFNTIYRNIKRNMILDILNNYFMLNYNKQWDIAYKKYYENLLNTFIKKHEINVVALKYWVDTYEENIIFNKLYNKKELESNE